MRHGAFGSAPFAVQKVALLRPCVLTATAIPGRRGLVQMAQRFSKAIRDKDGMMSTARVYTDVNVNRPKEYWDYENLSIEWG